MEIYPQLVRQVVDFATDIRCAAEGLSALVVDVCCRELSLPTRAEILALSDSDQLAACKSRLPRGGGWKIQLCCCSGRAYQQSPSFTLSPWWRGRDHARYRTFVVGWSAGAARRSRRRDFVDDDDRRPAAGDDGLDHGRHRQSRSRCHLHRRHHPALPRPVWRPALRSPAGRCAHARAVLPGFRQPDVRRLCCRGCAATCRTRSTPTRPTRATA
jgi:hypothetical protein